MMLLLLSPILCSLVRVYQMRATIMDENFPAFGASICHENYRLRAVIRHSPYSCQHPLTRKTCNNHSGSQKLAKESKSQVNSLYRIVEGKSLLEILNYFELWIVQYIVVDLNRLQNEFGTFIPKIQSSTEFQNIWSTSLFNRFIYRCLLAKVDKLDFDINELVCPRLVFQEEICWFMAFGHTINALWKVLFVSDLNVFLHCK